MSDLSPLLKPGDLGLGHLFARISEAVIIADVNTDRIVLWNPAAERLFGYSSEEAVGLPVDTIVPERYKAAHREGMARFKATGHGAYIDSHVPFEMPALTKAGREIDIEMSLSVVGVMAPGQGFAMAIIRDITERKRLEERLTRQNAELGEANALIERLIENVPAAIAYLDKNLIYRWNNPAHSRQVGLPKSAIIGHPVSAVMPGAEQTLVPLYRRVLASGKPYFVTAMPVRFNRDGRDHTSHWDIAYIPVPGKGGQPDGLMLVGTEVSERVELEQLQSNQIVQLKQIDRMKDQFLSLLSHELRTPLNAIMGFASVLDDEVAGPLNQQQHSYMEKILGGTEVLLSLINDLLDMSRIQAGKFTLSPAPMRLRTVAKEVLANLGALGEQRHHRLILDVPEDLPVLTADAQRIGQVLTNLVGNAIKFTPDGGTIILRACRDGEWLRCEVQDTGIGIRPEDQVGLFLPFTQVDSTSTRRVGGTGLGLSIVKALVEAHGGQVGVQSAPGQGATFWFELPLAGPDSRPSPS